MRAVYAIPPITAARAAWQTQPGAGGPVHHQTAKAKYLARLGWLTQDTPDGAPLTHAHGVTAEPTAVLTIHAVWPVQLYPEHPAFWDDQNAIMQQAMAERTHVTVALSAYTAARCRELVPAVRVQVIPQAFDAEEWAGVAYCAAPLPYLPADRPLVLWAKNAALPLCDPEPVLTLARAVPEAVYALCCDRAALPADLPANVYALGALDFRAYQRLVARCTIFLATTLEASGQAHLEAMHLGKPVLGYAWGGVAETVQDGVQGALVPPDCPYRLAAGYARIRQHYPAYSQAARVQARRYTWHAIAPQYVALYEDLLEEFAV